MRIVLDIGADQLERLRRVLAPGGYSDIHEFVRAAISNLIEMEIAHFESTGTATETTDDATTRGVGISRGRTNSEIDQDVRDLVVPQTSEGASTVNPPSESRLLKGP